MNTTLDNLAPIFDSLILKHSDPVVVARPADGKYRPAYPVIEFKVKLLRSDDGAVLYDGPYSMGIGHLERPSGLALIQYPTLSEYISKPWSVNPPTSPQALEEWSALAHNQRLTPDKLDVFSSLLMDGTPYFDAMDFSEWADHYGYSADSIKAKTVYDTCLQIGMRLRRAYSNDELEALRDWASRR